MAEPLDDIYVDPRLILNYDDVEYNLFINKPVESAASQPTVDISTASNILPTVDVPPVDNISSVIGVTTISTNILSDIVHLLTFHVLVIGHTPNICTSYYKCPHLRMMQTRTVNDLIELVCAASNQLRDLIESGAEKNKCSLFIERVLTGHGEIYRLLLDKLSSYESLIITMNSHRVTKSLNNIAVTRNTTLASNLLDELAAGVFSPKLYRLIIHYICRHYVDGRCDIQSGLHCDQADSCSRKRELDHMSIDDMVRALISNKTAVQQFMLDSLVKYDNTCFIIMALTSCDDVFIKFRYFISDELANRVNFQTDHASVSIFKTVKWLNYQAQGPKRERGGNIRWQHDTRVEDLQRQSRLLLMKQQLRTLEASFTAVNRDLDDIYDDVEYLARKRR